MCGRYSLASDEFSELMLEFQLELFAAPAFASAPAPTPAAWPGAPALRARYNIAPTWAPGHEPPIVIETARGRELAAARWWLIPSGWERPLKRLPTSFNARAEELSNKRFWSRSFDARRCLVPATGWREFSGASKQPHHFHFEHRVFAFAGVWDEWAGPDGQCVRSFAIVTVPANDVVRPVHDRMPLRVEPAQYAAWLDTTRAGADALAEVRAAAPPLPSRYESDPSGNDVRREGPGVIAPARSRQLDLFGS